MRGRSHDHFYTLDGLYKAKKTPGYWKYITKHFKAIVSVHLEKFKNQMYIHKHWYMPTSYKEDISIDQASPNPDGKR